MVGGEGSIYERKEYDIKKEKKEGERWNVNERVDERERQQVCRRVETDAEEIYTYKKECRQDGGDGVGR